MQINTIKITHPLVSSATDPLILSALYGREQHSGGSATTSLTPFIGLPWFE